jgi:hypothetical protein
VLLPYRKKREEEKKTRTGSKGSDMPGNLSTPSSPESSSTLLSHPNPSGVSLEHPSTSPRSTTCSDTTSEQDGLSAQDEVDEEKLERNRSVSEVHKHISYPILYSHNEPLVVAAAFDLVESREAREYMENTIKIQKAKKSRSTSTPLSSRERSRKMRSSTPDSPKSREDSSQTSKGCGHVFVPEPTASDQDVVDHRSWDLFPWDREGEEFLKSLLFYLSHLFECNMRLGANFTCWWEDVKTNIEKLYNKARATQIHCEPATSTTPNTRSKKGTFKVLERGLHIHNVSLLLPELTTFLCWGLDEENRSSLEVGRVRLQDYEAVKQMVELLQYVAGLLGPLIRGQCPANYPKLFFDIQYGYRKIFSDILRFILPQEMLDVYKSIIKAECLSAKTCGHGVMTNYFTRVFFFLPLSHLTMVLRFTRPERTYHINNMLNIANYKDRTKEHLRIEYNAYLALIKFLHERSIVFRVGWMRKDHGVNAFLLRILEVEKSWEMISSIVCHTEVVFYGIAYNIDDEDESEERKDE